jgi:chromosome segregation protein
MRKLEETEQNLLRVNDIVVEVKRQIGSLERQANRARRYKEIFEELKLKAKQIMKESDSFIIFKNRDVKWLEKEIIGEEKRSTDNLI